MCNTICNALKWYVKKLNEDPKEAKPNPRALSQNPKEIIDFSQKKMLFTGIPYLPNLSLLPQITSKWVREKEPAMALETLGAPTSNHDGAGYFWEATKDTVAEGLNAVVLFSLPTSLQHWHVRQTASSGSFIAAAPSSGVGRKNEYRDYQT